jgi:cytochrome c553
MGLGLLLGAVWPLVLHAAPAPAADDVEIGRRIYQEGIRPSGAPLTGTRLGGAAVSGADAACMTCHRRSGMGSVEGDIQVSPITGNYLFGLGDKPVATMDPRSGKAFNRKHDPYTTRSLAEALRQGMNNAGRQMSAAMPRYALDDREIGAVAAYLKQLSRQWSPGVSADTIRFATVITPGVDPKRRQAVLDMLRTAFVQKNGSTFPGRRYMTSSAEMMLGTGRKWALDVWELQGPPDTWEGQLEERYRRQPVFALVSGLSDTTWEPVQRFCQQERVPCWFPSVDLPPGGQGFYSVYFSRGVALEAAVLAKHLRDDKDARPRRLVQVYRDDYVGRGAAEALRQALADSGIQVEDRVLGDGPDGLSRAVATIAPGDAAMFWLRAGDLAALEKVPPLPSPAYFSAELADGEHGPFPASWKAHARLVYPYELPDKREANLAYFRAWLRLRRLPLVDEPLQSEVYFALNFLTDTVGDMLDNLYRDYLMERAEDMISRREGITAEDQARARDVFREPERLLPVRYRGAMPEGRQQGRQQGTTIYPHLSLGPGQRFASKGGYIVRFAGAGDDKLVAESDWIVP